MSYTFRELKDILYDFETKHPSLLDKQVLVFAGGDMYPLKAVSKTLDLQDKELGLELGCGWEPLEEDDQ